MKKEGITDFVSVTEIINSNDFFQQLEDLNNNDDYFLEQRDLDFHLRKVGYIS